jgi:hypothetical protein
LPNIQLFDQPHAALSQCFGKMLVDEGWRVNVKRVGSIWQRDISRTEWHQLTCGIGVEILLAHTSSAHHLTVS